MTYITNYPGLIEWRLNGEHGASSRAIADQLQYGRQSDGWNGGNYPRDPSDFRRCQLLLTQCLGMRADLHLIKHVCPEWSALVERWNEIAALAEEEVPDYLTSGRGSAPRTYALMRQIIEGAA